MLKDIKFQFLYSNIAISIDALLMFVLSTKIKFWALLFVSSNHDIFSHLVLQQMEKTENKIPNIGKLYKNQNLLA